MPNNKSEYIILKWDIFSTTDDITDDKQMIVSRQTLNSEKKGKLEVNTGKDFLYIVGKWQDEEKLSSNSTIQYRFDKEEGVILTPSYNMSSATILYEINSTNLNQEKDIIDFIKKMLTSKNVIMRIGDYGGLYTFDLDGFNEVLNKVDFSGTFLDKYKNQTIK